LPRLYRGKDASCSPSSPYLCSRDAMEPGICWTKAAVPRPIGFLDHSQGNSGESSYFAVVVVKWAFKESGVTGRCRGRSRSRSPLLGKTSRLCLPETTFATPALQRMRGVSESALCCCRLDQRDCVNADRTAGHLLGMFLMKTCDIYSPRIVPFQSQYEKHSKIRHYSLWKD
jgi:hypothetical protein